MRKKKKKKKLKEMKVTLRSRNHVLISSQLFKLTIRGFTLQVWSMVLLFIDNAPRQFRQVATSTEVAATSMKNIFHMYAYCLVYISCTLLICIGILKEFPVWGQDYNKMEYCKRILNRRRRDRDWNFYNSLVTANSWQ
jgi:hypothetical protein